MDEILRRLNEHDLVVDDRLFDRLLKYWNSLNRPLSAPQTYEEAFKIQTDIIVNGRILCRELRETLEQPRTLVAGASS